MVYCSQSISLLMLSLSWSHNLGVLLLVDTEGSFFVERVREMAEAFVKHMKKLAANSKDPHHQAAVS